MKIEQYIVYSGSTLIVVYLNHGTDVQVKYSHLIISQHWYNKYKYSITVWVAPPERVVLVGVVSIA